VNYVFYKHVLQTKLFANEMSCEQGVLQTKCLANKASCKNIRFSNDVLIIYDDYYYNSIHNIVYQCAIKYKMLCDWPDSSWPIN
jgi:hypothetical protein